MNKKQIRQDLLTYHNMCDLLSNLVESHNNLSGVYYKKIYEVLDLTAKFITSTDDWERAEIEEKIYEILS